MPELNNTLSIRHKDDVGGDRITTFTDDTTTPTKYALGTVLVDEDCVPVSEGGRAVGVAPMPIVDGGNLTYTSATLVVNGSVASVNIDRTVAASVVEVVHQLTFRLEQGANTAFDPELFIDAAALGNGCIVQLVDTDGATVLETIGTITMNRDFDFLSKLHGNGATPSENTGAATNVLLAPIVFQRPRRLSAGQILRVVVQDNLTAAPYGNLTEFQMLASIEQFA
jgi:hypothetical protein